MGDEDNLKGEDFYLEIKNRQADNRVDRMIKRWLKIRNQASLDAALGAAYASLQDHLGYTYPTLDELYVDVVSVRQRRVLSVTEPPLFKTEKEHLYVLSPEARRDLRTIRRSVSREEGGRSGEEVVRAIIRDIGWLADVPTVGTPRQDLDGFPYGFPGRYGVYFHLTRKPRGIKVVRILDSGQFDNDVPGTAT